MDVVLGELLYTTLALFIILDPLLSVPLFVNMTKGKSAREVGREAGITIGTARKTETSAAVIIGTPLLCGPGTITTVLLFSKQFGIPVVALASALSLAGSWLVLKYSALIQQVLGETVTDIMSKVLGMLVAAIAVQIIVAGVKSLVMS